MGALLERDKKDFRVLSEEDIVFLLKNTTFTRQKLIEQHKNFIRDCPTGLLDKKTYIKHYQDLYPEGKAQKFCNQIFEKFDIDKNGKIDFNEYILAMFALSQAIDLNGEEIGAYTSFAVTRYS
ncbi:Neuronal calcium sensor 2 [Brachionus plicatilis]|uniref:Neuronal calcium sensor 2 n=1 Tax=Brachionus plicatilis TaxID=10195 RepID=A0A3M7PVV4_BRAPC|nr:Neuronal calcium sensor 2 [Brachionus plicatilis]